MPIQSLQARQIIDSRGNPTVEVDLVTENGIFKASVPSGVSASSYEAFELRDNDKSKYHGKSVFKAVQNVNSIIAPQLQQAVNRGELKITQQAEIDNLLWKLDGTPNKSKLGANAILGVSVAVCKAGAAERGVPLYKYIAELADNKQIVLPTPAFNLINGGVYAGNRLPFQEFLILPVGASNFTEAIKMGSEIYHYLKAGINNKFGLDGTAVGDEGGFLPNILDYTEALNLIVAAITAAGYTGKVKIAIDAAASEFHTNGKYDLNFKNEKSDPSTSVTPEALKNLYLKLAKEYPIVSIEDPFDQNDWASWSSLTAATPIQIVGDDLTVTNPERIKTAIEKKACNSILLKVNQIGSVTESINAHKMAKAAGWGTMVSHRFGETEDTFIADLVVGLSTGQLKAGSPCRSEHLAKYNQILRIEEELGAGAKYAGEKFRKPWA